MITLIIGQWRNIVFQLVKQCHYNITLNISIKAKYILLILDVGRGLGKTPLDPIVLSIFTNTGPFSSLNGFISLIFTQIKFCNS